MTHKYFCYDPDTGFDTYETPEQAKEAAEVAIDYYRDNADEGWNEEVCGVCWGEIKQHTVCIMELDVEQAKKEGYTVPKGYSGISDYDLVDIK